MSQSKPIIVGFAGRAGAGKSTFAKKVKDVLDRRLMSVIGYNPLDHRAVSVDSFAQPIRDALRQLHIEKEHPLYRSMAQDIGARCRQHDKDHFVKLMQKRISFVSWRHMKEPARVILIDDCRHLNEFDILDHLFFIERPEHLVHQLTNEQRAHESEHYAVIGPSNWPYEYRNKAIVIDNVPDKPLDSNVKAVADIIWTTLHGE